MGINQAVGDQIRHLRQVHGMTQQQLAEQSDLSIDHIGKIERGVTSPTVEALAQVARGLGVSIATLFDLYEETVSADASTTAIAELSRYLRRRRPEDAEFALSVIRQILER